MRSTDRIPITNATAAPNENIAAAISAAPCTWCRRMWRASANSPMPPTTACTATSAANGTMLSESKNINHPASSSSNRECISVTGQCRLRSTMIPSVMENNPAISRYDPKHAWMNTSPIASP